MDAYETALSLIIAAVYSLLHADKTGHDFYHCFDVFLISMSALEYEPTLDDCAKFYVLCAALLHEVDDAKLFNTVNYANARRILGGALACTPLDAEHATKAIIDMISTISTSANGLRTDNLTWKDIPSIADKVLAIGHVGCERTILYTKAKDQPMSTDATPRLVDEAEIIALAQERFETYTGGSVSAMDHFYDKLVHLADKLRSDNPYLSAYIAEQRQTTLDYVVHFGKYGTMLEM